jgi:exodeoxyribonuclease VII small subunit
MMQHFPPLARPPAGGKQGCTTRLQTAPVSCITCPHAPSHADDYCRAHPSNDPARHIKPPSAKPFDPGGKIQYVRPLFLCWVIMSRTSAPPPPDTLNFETALAELESLAARMENGQLPLEESLAAWQRGMSLLARCQTLLQEADNRVKIMEDGILKPFLADENAR